MTTGRGLTVEVDSERSGQQPAPTINFMDKNEDQKQTTSAEATDGAGAGCAAPTGSASVLFLDVDGVLNTAHTPNSLMSDKIGQVRRIVQETGCKIILSSMWRRYPSLLERVKLELKIDGITPILDEEVNGLWRSATRDQEINAWLASNGKPRNYVILDDCPVHGFGDRFVQTDIEHGLTPDLAREVIRRLNDPDQATASEKRGGHDR